MMSRKHNAVTTKLHTSGVFLAGHLYTILTHKPPNMQEIVTNKKGGGRHRAPEAHFFAQVPLH